MPVINLPSYEQFETLNLTLQQMADRDKIIHDLTNSPGSKVLARGNMDAGFYGFVQPSEMGLIAANADGFKDFSGANLALACGLATGTSFNPNVPLMKFHSKGEVLFVPLTGYRHSVAWDAIYNAGMAYDTADEGFLPPCGRAGIGLSINATDNSINTTTQRFVGDKTATTDYADVVGAVGNLIVLKGWSNSANNVTATIVSITNEKIVVSGATLVTETGNKLSRIYNNAKKITQGKILTIGNKSYKIRLMKGAGADPTDTFADADRGATGAKNEWNSLILPLHEHAKLGNWTYPAYATDANGIKITSNWGIGLTDKNLRTHYLDGAGSYTWCQEVIDTLSWRRVLRGNLGASFSYDDSSWNASDYRCWRPVLVSL